MKYELKNIQKEYQRGKNLYKGWIITNEIPADKEDFLDELDANNFGGNVCFYRTIDENVIEFAATVYTD